MTAPADAATPAWAAACASRRGSSHGSGVPNQDAVRCDRLSRPGRPDVWVAAVADGHGGQRYVRSDVGARTAVDVAVDAVCEALRRSPDAEPALLLRAEASGIVEAWRDAVRGHAREHPFTPEEQDRAGGQPLGGGSLTAYGATLLVAVVGEEGVALAQVGDGDALVRSHGFATRPVPGDPRLVAGETTSLCLDSAVEDFRYAVIPATAESDLVLLATDGYGNSFAQPDWWHTLLGDVASFVDRLGFHQLEQQLPGWLDESARVGGDDVSAVVVVREPFAVAPPRTATEGASVGARALSVPHTLDLPAADAPTSGPGSPAPRRRRRRRPFVAALAAAVAALLVGVGAAFALWPDGPEPAPDTPPGPTSTTTPTDEGSGDGDGRRKGRGKGDRNAGTPGPGDPPAGPEKKKGEAPEEVEDPGVDDPRKPLPGEG